MRRNRIVKWALLGLLVAFSTACAADVGDIDRTQPNKVKKAELEGTWYMRHTIVDVPPSVANIFVGWASPMEKVRWDVQEDYVIAYRAYEETPGYDEKAGSYENGEQQFADGRGEGRGEEYQEEPIAAYPIQSHFDVQRQYNPNTGEPTNVIVENQSDRPWHEREYMRVDWSTNLIKFSLPFSLGLNGNQSFYVQANEGGTDSFYEEHRDLNKEKDGEELSYFDFTIKTESKACGQETNTEGNSGGRTGVCAFSNNEMEIRSSFQRIENDQRDYQRVFYDDNMMTKFGYFRTERPVYDRRKGFTDSGIIKLVNRHDIWKNDFQTDDNGDYIRDKAGQRIPTPMAEREPKPVVYYLSPHFPDSMMPAVERMGEDYDKAFKEAVAAAKFGSMDTSKVETTMFHICENPVPADAPEACDPRPESKQVDGDDNYIPYEVRAGDVRRSFIYWVQEPQQAGPLGYGPSYADPETGEIISGAAYVYGAGVDTVAGDALDIVKLLRGDLSMEDAMAGEDIEQYIMENLDGDVDPRADISAETRQKLKNTKLTEVSSKMLDKGKRQKLEQLRNADWDDMQTAPNRRDKKLKELKEHGFDQLMLNDEMVRGLSDGEVDPQKASGDKLRKMLEETNPFDVGDVLNDKQHRLEELAEHNVYMADAALDAVYGAAVRYSDMEDYDKIYQRLRNDIFRGVMLHEIGHTVGLRHNFAGSYDSVNYDNKYWDLRKKNFQIPANVEDFYEQASLTKEQRSKEMTRHMYSSIMDYHSRFNGDNSGLGKYDHAAIRFAYSFGTYNEVEKSNTDPTPVQEGYVEVFSDPPSSVNLPWASGSVDPKNVFFDYDDRYSPADHPLEDFHYSSVVELLGGPEKLTNRELRRYSKLKKKQENGVSDRPIEVQYMNCTDTFNYVYVSCETWDLGADPFEKVKWAVQDYKAYYPFTHFRRDRLSFSSLNGALAAQRTFQSLPNLYQRWVFSLGRIPDPILSQYFLFASFSGLNLLGDVLATPSYGGYVETSNYEVTVNDDESSGDIYEVELTGDNCEACPIAASVEDTETAADSSEVATKLAAKINQQFQDYADNTDNYNVEVLAIPRNEKVELKLNRTTMKFDTAIDVQNGSSSQFVIEPRPRKQLVTRDKQCEEGEQVSDSLSVDECIKPGPGRSLYSQYDYGSGIYYFNRPTESGHFWDQFIAMNALTASTARAIGVNQQEQFRSYLLPYYLFFENEMTNLVNGIFSENYRKFGPYLNGDGNLVKRPMTTLQMSGGQQIDPLTGETVRPMGSSMPQDASVVDTRLSFSIRFQSYLLGVQFFNSNYSQHYIDQSRIFKVGSGEEIAGNPAEGFEQVTFTDPSTGITYGAVRDTNASEETLAVSMVEDAKALRRSIKSTQDQAVKERFQQQLSQLVEDMNVMIDAVEYLGVSL